MTHDLRVERVFDAAPEVGFDAFTDPDAQRELYADAPDWIVEAECDLRVGGRWSIAFGPSGSAPARETNVFQVVDRPRRLVYTSTMTMPDGSSLDTDMQVTFEKDSGVPPHAAQAARDTLGGAVAAAGQLSGQVGSALLAAAARRSPRACSWPSRSAPRSRSPSPSWPPSCSEGCAPTRRNLSDDAVPARQWAGGWRRSQVLPSGSRRLAKRPHCMSSGGPLKPTPRSRSSA